MKSKICKKCGKEKPLSQYRESRQNKDGHRNKCKECNSKEAKQYYYEKGGKEKAKKRYLSNKERRIDYSKEWAKQNREKINRERKIKRLNKNRKKFKENIIRLITEEAERREYEPVRQRRLWVKKMIDYFGFYPGISTYYERHKKKIKIKDAERYQKNRQLLTNTYIKGLIVKNEPDLKHENIPEELIKLYREYYLLKKEKNKQFKQKTA